MTGVIFGKHIDKGAVDRAKGIFTLPVILGDTAARFTATLLLLSQYAVLGWLCATGKFSLWAMLAFQAYPNFLQAARYFASPIPKSQNDVHNTELRKVWPNYFAAIAFRHNFHFGALLAIGLLVSSFTR